MLPKHARYQLRHTPVIKLELELELELEPELEPGLSNRISLNSRIQIIRYPPREFKSFVYQIYTRGWQIAALTGFAYIRIASLPSISVGALSLQDVLLSFK